MRLKYSIFICQMAIMILFTSCEKEEKASTFGSSCIKRSISPNIVDGKIEFAFAMAVQPTLGKLSDVRVQTSIPGATGTYLDPKSYRTNNTGLDIGVTVVENSTLEGSICSTKFIVDTCASTLRYYYFIPEEARGKEVSFEFTGKNSNNEETKQTMGPYKISNMSMKKDIKLTSGAICYLSIKDMMAYSSADIATNPQLAAEIDLVYVYSANVALKHSLYAPSAPEAARPGVTFPAGVVADTKLVRTWALRDQQLSNLQWGIFVDDIDLEKQSFAGGSNFLLDLKQEAGTWVQTADKKFRAYVFINTISDSRQEMVVSMKRLSGSF